VLRDDFAGERRDVLVEFLPEARASLFDMARMQNRLATIVSRAVDLRTLQNCRYSVTMSPPKRSKSMSPRRPRRALDDRGRPTAGSCAELERALAGE
jgi:hypothetical protein